MPTSPVADIKAVRVRLLDSGVSASVFGGGGKVEEAVDLAIQSALKEYSRDRPKEFVGDVTGNGTSYYKLVGTSPVLASWSDEFSIIRRIEYPAAAVSATHRPTFLDEVTDYRADYKTADSTYLYFPRHSPTASQTIRVTYTGLRVLTVSSDTIVAADREAFLDLATSIACVMLASNAPSSVSGAQGVEFQQVAEDTTASLLEVAREWRRRYQQHIGQGAAEVSAASTIRDWDYPPTRAAGPRGGRFSGWLTHGGRR